MSEPTQEQIEVSNRRDLWRDVAANLHVARDSIELAQGSLDDLRVYGVDGAAFAEQLQPIVDDLRRAANDADEQATA